MKLAISRNVVVQTNSPNILTGFMVNVCVESARQEIQEVIYSYVKQSAWPFCSPRTLTPAPYKDKAEGFLPIYAFKLSWSRLCSLVS